MQKLTERQLATILHGLRTIQADGRIEGCAAASCDHFEDVSQLTNTEIDTLCEALNCGDYDELMSKPPVEPKELTKLIHKLKRKFDGDSNDAEHDAAVELVDYLEAHRFPGGMVGKVPKFNQANTDYVEHMNQEPMASMLRDKTPKF